MTAPAIELVALDMAGTTIDDGGAVYEALRGAVEDAGARIAHQLGPPVHLDLGPGIAEARQAAAERVEMRQAPEEFLRDPHPLVVLPHPPRPSPCVPPPT